MHQTVPHLETSDPHAAQPPFKWKRYAAFPTLICLYVLIYAILRLTGVFHLFWNMGDWDNVDGSTGSEVVDVMFLPAARIELYLQNRFKLTPPPAGG